MKSLIQKWSKKSKGKGGSSNGGSDNGSRETSSDLARLSSGQKQASFGSPVAKTYPSMEAKDFGKVCPASLPFFHQSPHSNNTIWSVSARGVHSVSRYVLPAQLSAQSLPL